MRGPQQVQNILRQNSRTWILQLLFGYSGSIACLPSDKWRKKNMQMTPVPLCDEQGHSRRRLISACTILYNKTRARAEHSSLLLQLKAKPSVFHPTSWWVYFCVAHRAVKTPPSPALGSQPEVHVLRLGSQNEKEKSSLWRDNKDFVQVSAFVFVLDRYTCVIALCFCLCYRSQ